jgi:hypothetical protein
MDASTFQKMLEHRGYQPVRHETQEYHEVFFIGDDTQLSIERDDFPHMSYEEARDDIDAMMAEGLKHVVHPCGQVLLEPDMEWDGGEDREPGFYLVPLRVDSKPIERCPTCGMGLQFDYDNEAFQVEETIFLRVGDDKPEV